MTYDHLFERATRTAPYPYQRALATCERWPAALVAPTGAGKTAAVDMAWLYRRRFAAAAIRAATPRRLLLCLPMRTLVTQTTQAAKRWLDRLDLHDPGTGLDRGQGIGLHQLQGGSVDEEWPEHPERDAILVGTQDMLLSRALNRGYGGSRFRWPWEYGLLSNDCAWVFDEIQLMGVGLATGLQLEAWRRRLGTFGPTTSLFMSATLDPAWLSTIDHPPPETLLTLGEDDLASEPLRRRRFAPKRLLRANTVLDKDFARPLADEVLAAHQPGSRTLVVLNTVDRAISLFEAIDKRPRARGVATILLHSRFRPADRDRHLERALAPDFDGIVVSTQVIEAGVDVSARTLFTELAPWPSLVQRAGRCNRAGELDDAAVHWIDPDTSIGSPPYAAEDLSMARQHLERLSSFNPDAIARAGVSLGEFRPAHVLRRRDIVDLFDTTPDLGGSDLDVSRYIRDGVERDLQVFWRAVDGAPPASEPRPERAELCGVPVNELRAWTSPSRLAFRWDILDGKWQLAQASSLVPGAQYLLCREDGGYLPSRGWSPKSTEIVSPVTIDQRRGRHPEEPMDGDPSSEISRWVPLATHSHDARTAAEEICSALGLPELPVETVVRASHAHDAGKAHSVFQETMRKNHPGDDAQTLWAKSGHSARHSRRGFRHELASALAWLAHGTGLDRVLVAYLAAAHHGKVRLSIRALPTDGDPGDGRLHARGVWEGDALPAVDLGEGVTLPPMTLSLAPMRLGRNEGEPSWAELALSLRDHWGPFRLAYLEALVRAADVRATQRERRGEP